MFGTREKRESAIEEKREEKGKGVKKEERFSKVTAQGS
jgi:hypothetical protein